MHPCTWYYPADVQLLLLRCYDGEDALVVRRLWKTESGNKCGLSSYVPKRGTYRAGNQISEVKL